jgi:uncharacterized protein YdcH (DUF465 family)
MTHTPHELADDFPGQAEAIHRLKAEDGHFARLVEDYHEVNRAVHRAEARIDTIAEPEEAQLRRPRMALKDAIARRLGAA